VTTIHDAVSSASYAQKSKHAAVRPVALLCLISFALAGCETGSNVLGNGAETQPQTNLVQSPPPAAQTRISIAPVIGAPDAVARQLQQDVASSVVQYRVAVVPAGERADYTLRGYVVAAKDRANTKVSYIWDVTDPTGKRVNRITGEEVITGQAPKEPWTAVTPQLTQTIAQKSAASFGAWLPTAPSQAAVAGAGGVQPVGVGAAGGAPVSTASAPGLAPAGGGVSARPPLTPVSVTGGNMAAIVPSVVGAPGDGATSLTAALQGELTKNGVPLTQQVSATSYRVEGVVKVGQPKDGKQPIQIDWNVKDPQGKKLGTVSQKNEIPEGSLDGTWGKTADAAAAAAAQGILKLLPQRQ
jgi:hypothetical protein